VLSQAEFPPVLFPFKGASNSLHARGGHGSILMTVIVAGTLVRFESAIVSRIDESAPL
jgi:hypothetical protein